MQLGQRGEGFKSPIQTPEDHKIETQIASSPPPMILRLGLSVPIFFRTSMVYQQPTTQSKGCSEEPKGGGSRDPRGEGRHGRTRMTDNSLA